MTKSFLRIALLFFVFLAPVFSGTFNITTDSDFLSGNLSNCDIVGSGTNGTLQLKTNSSSSFGCTAKVDASSSFSMTNTDRQVSIRFTAQNTQTLDKIILLVEVVGVLTPTYDCKIYLDDGTTHLPTGGALSSAVINCASFASTGTQLVTVDMSDYLLTGGQSYHILINDNALSADAGKYLGVYSTTPKTGIVSYNNAADSQLALLQTIDGGVTWVDSNSQPIYALIPTGGGTNEGNVFYVATTFLPVQGAKYYGERINITGSSVVVSKVSFYVKTNTSTPPAEHLYAVLYSITDGVELESVKLADKNDITTSYEWYSANFSKPRTLETGKSYRVYLKSPLSTNVNFYQAYRVETFTPSNGTLEGLTYDGTNSVYLENTTGSWVEVEKTDLAFRFTTATYQSSGNYVSTNLDAEATAAFNTLSWQPATGQPAGTAVKFQLASALTQIGPWNYYGPDGTSSTYYTVSGQTISPIHSGKRYMFVKSFLESASNDTTPVVNSISIDYSARVLPGTSLQTVCFPVPFNPGAGSKMAINYILTKDSKVTLRLYSLTGTLVKEVICASGADGGRGDTSGFNNKIEWNGTNGDGMGVASGVYVIRLVVEPADGTEKIIESKKIMVIR